MVRCEHQRHDPSKACRRQIVDGCLDRRCGVLEAERDVKSTGIAFVEGGLQGVALGLGTSGEW